VEVALHFPAQVVLSTIENAALGGLQQAHRL